MPPDAKRDAVPRLARAGVDDEALARTNADRRQRPVTRAPADEPAVEVGGRLACVDEGNAPFGAVEGDRVDEDAAGGDGLAAGLLLGLLVGLLLGLLRIGGIVVIVAPAADEREGGRTDASPSSSPEQSAPIDALPSEMLPASVYVHSPSLLPFVRMVAPRGFTMGVTA